MESQFFTSLAISSPNTNNWEVIGVEMFFKFGLIIYRLLADKLYCTCPCKIRESDKRSLACLLEVI